MAIPFESLAVSFLLGFGDGIFQNQICSLIGLLYPSERDAAARNGSLSKTTKLRIKRQKLTKARARQPSLASGVKPFLLLMNLTITAGYELLGQRLCYIIEGASINCGLATVTTRLPRSDPLLSNFVVHTSITRRYHGPFIG